MKASPRPEACPGGGRQAAESRRLSRGGDVAPTSAAAPTLAVRAGAPDEGITDGTSTTATSRSSLSTRGGGRPTHPWWAGPSPGTRRATETAGGSPRSEKCRPGRLARGSQTVPEPPPRHAAPSHMGAGVLGGAAPKQATGDVPGSAREGRCDSRRRAGRALPGLPGPEWPIHSIRRRISNCATAKTPCADKRTRFGLIPGSPGNSGEEAKAPTSNASDSRYQSGRALVRHAGDCRASRWGGPR